MPALLSWHVLGAAGGPVILLVKTLFEVAPKRLLTFSAQDVSECSGWHV